eukprot:3119221-Karenia_brevis.AAC.1
MDALNLADICDKSVELKTRVLHQWEKDCQQLVKALHGWVPEKWQVHKQRLLDHPEVLSIH